MDHKGPVEAALSTDLRGEPYNFSLWDIHTGTQLVSFKGNKSNIVPKCLQLIDNNYFITASENMLQIWSIFNKKCQDQKLFLPGRPSTICVSPCANYLVAGISEMIYVWQFRSGNLLAHTQRHYQTVSVLKMNQEGSFLFSGGEDGLVLVWPFADLISNSHHTGALNLSKTKRDTGLNEPKFTWQHHDSQVTDLHVTNGGRCVTVSVDATVNIYSYTTGKRLFCITMPAPIWSVVMNKNETKMFLGAQDGNIYEMAVSSISASVVNSMNKSEEARRPVFSGHKGKVNCLLVTTDGLRLVSGSMDSSCKIWDIRQKKMLQDIKHQAPLANLTSLLVPESLALSTITQSRSRPALGLKPLKRDLYKPPREGTVMTDELFEESGTTIINVKNPTYRPNLTESSQPTDKIPENLDITKLLQKPKQPVLNNDDDGSTIQNLKAKMTDLYLLSAEKIFRNAAEESLKPYKTIVESTKQ